MSKYEPLAQWFKKQPLSTKEVVLTFADIEQIIGDTLPSGARKNFTSWANFHSPLQDSWFNAGWRTVMVDFENERVKFQRNS